MLICTELTEETRRLRGQTFAAQGYSGDGWINSIFVRKFIPTTGLLCIIHSFKDLNIYIIFISQALCEKNASKCKRLCISIKEIGCSTQITIMLS